MEKGMIKIIIKVTIIAIVLLAASLLVAVRYGGLMMKSVSTSQQTNQDNQTIMSETSISIN